VREPETVYGYEYEYRYGAHHRPNKALQPTRDAMRARAQCGK
jgi:hypothetical protein